MLIRIVPVVIDIVVFHSWLLVHLFLGVSVGQFVPVLDLDHIVKGRFYWFLTVEAFFIWNLHYFELTVVSQEQKHVSSIWRKDYLDLGGDCFIIEPQDDALDLLKAFLALVKLDIDALVDVANHFLESLIIHLSIDSVILNLGTGNAIRFIRSIQTLYLTASITMVIIRVFI